MPKFDSWHFGVTLGRELEIQQAVVKLMTDCSTKDGKVGDARFAEG